MQGEPVLSLPRTADRATSSSAVVTRVRGLPQGEWLLFLLFAGPNLILFGLFSYWPLVYSAYLSAVRWDMISPRKRWVGLDNYRYLLHDDTFRTVFFNSIYFTLGAVGGSMLLGLLSALLLNERLRSRDVARAVVFMPTLLSGAAIGIVWVYIFDPRYGLLNTLLDVVQIDSPNWLRDTTWAMPAVIIVYVWKNLGFATVIYLAGLQAIPRDLYEAAKIDGASVLWRFRSVTLPMLSPITFFLAVTSMLNSFQAFDIIRVMTRGGPVDATNNLVYYVYEEGFVAFNAGRASAAAMILFGIMLLITLIQLKRSEASVHYGS